MYRKDEQPTTSAESFKLPFEGKLSEENRWVIMAQWIPWEEFEAEYAELFSSVMGAHFDKLNDHQPKHLEWHWEP